MLEDGGKAGLFEIRDERSRSSGRWALIFAFLQIFMTRFLMKTTEYPYSHLNQHNIGTSCPLPMKRRPPVG